MGKNKTFKERYDGLIDVIEEALQEHIEDKDYGRALTIAEDVAKKMHEDRRDISNIFRFIAGMPLGTYLKNRKLEIAFTAKLQGKKPTWEEAGLMVYKDAASFKSAFRREYNMSVREAEKDPGLVKLTKPLYLDSVMKGEEAVMNCNTYINKTALTGLKNYELYSSLYNIGYNQLSFAQSYVKNEDPDELEYVLCVLAEKYPDKVESRFTDTEAAAFDLVISHGFARDAAEKLVANLISEGISDISCIERAYYWIMVNLLYFIENQDEDYRYKYLTYADFLEVKSLLQKKGYTSDWDIYGAVTIAEDEKTWEENVSQYLTYNPEPIEGDWNEDEYMTACGIFADVPIAKTLKFAEDVYGREKFSRMRGKEEELVFAAMFFEGLSEQEAKKFIYGGAPEKIEEFLAKDYDVNFKYNLLKEGEA